MPNDEDPYLQAILEKIEGYRGRMAPGPGEFSETVEAGRAGLAGAKQSIGEARKVSPASRAALLQRARESTRGQTQAGLRALSGRKSAIEGVLAQMARLIVRRMPK